MGYDIVGSTRCVWESSLGGSGSFRWWSTVSREVRWETATYWSTDPCRPARQRRASLRERLLRSAPSSEGE